ncbi:hypothetical protein MMC25_005081 [Agyrium rufum]|nr:hypothetical protein [Agyrium rufum]
MLTLLAVVAASLLLSFAGAAPSATSLPIVDLGYQRHQAASFNSTGGFYNFSNIRYAQPPVGDLRFAAPVPPKGKSSAIDNGSVGRICPQSAGAWGIVTSGFIPNYIFGEPSNLTMLFAEEEFALAAGLPKQDPRTTEDCLFLDVIVPQKIFKKSVPASGKGGAPVMVWIYGGGYTEGEKTGGGGYTPAGLFRASQQAGSNGFVFMALNYRLGAFGWISGPTFQASGGIANAALYDQRLALQWVQDNIHKFGGDKTRVTVFGESAGAGSIMHQLTSFGGFGGPLPFSQALLQSPAFLNIPSTIAQEDTFQEFLTLLNVSSLAEVRALPSEIVIAANYKQVANSNFGTFTYGPTVDGVIAPSLPSRLLAEGSFHKNINVMVGHNGDEGLEFADPRVNSTADITAYLKLNYPGIPDSTINYVLDTLYPPIFDGSYGYTTNFQRFVLIASESSFSCNTRYLDNAYKNQTHAYEFDVAPALHGQDVVYTFFNGVTPSITNVSVANAMQDYFTSFVTTGAPSAKGFTPFPVYGPGSQIVRFTQTSIAVVEDDVANARCDYWQKGLYN